MRADSLKLMALFLAAIILLTATLTRLVITLPEVFISEPVGTGGNPAFRTPIAILLVITLILTVYAISKEKFIRYMLMGESKKNTWLNYVGWLLVLLLAYRYFTKPPEIVKTATNNTSIIAVPPQEGVVGSPTPVPYETLSPSTPVHGWGSVLNALPVIAVAILIAIYLSSEKLAEIVSPKSGQVEGLLEFVEMSGNPREVIIRAYRNAVVFLTRRGYPYKDSWTHREHEIHVAPKLGNSAENLSSLTFLFEIAKYSRRKVDKSHVSAAIRYYKKLRQGVEDGGT